MTLHAETIVAEVMMNLHIPRLGVAVVDQDHQDAIALIEVSKSADDSELEGLINKAAEHLADHFAREEALMDECGFFAAHCHKAEHTRVLAEVARIQKLGLEGDIASVRRYLVLDLPAWLQDHAASMDTVTMMAYRSFNSH